MDLAKIPISSLRLRACSETEREKSPFAIRSIWPEDRMMGMVILRVMAREKKMPMMRAAMPRTTKTMRAVKERLFASS